MTLPILNDENHCGGKICANHKRGIPLIIPKDNPAKPLDCLQEIFQQMMFLA